MAERTFAGLRLSKWMERLRVRTQAGDPPAVAPYSIGLQALVSDQSELTPDFPARMGTFGSNFFPSVGDCSVVLVKAGRFGCRVALDVQMTNAASLSVSWAVLPEGHPALALVTAPLAPATTAPLPIYNAYATEQAMDIGSVCTIGSMTSANVLAQFPPAVNPSYLIRDAGVAANGQFHTGGGQFTRPWFAVRPTRTFILFGRGVNTFLYYSGWITEAADEPSP